MINFKKSLGKNLFNVITSYLVAIIPAIIVIIYVLMVKPVERNSIVLFIEKFHLWTPPIMCACWGVVLFKLNVKELSRKLSSDSNTLYFVEFLFYFTLVGLAVLFLTRYGSLYKNHLPFYDTLRYDVGFRFELGSVMSLFYNYNIDNIFLSEFTVINVMITPIFYYICKLTYVFRHRIRNK